MAPSSRPASIDHVNNARAFTLLEMVVSLTIMSIVFLAIGSVMLLVTRAIPNADSATNLALQSTDIAESISDELRYAKTLVGVEGYGINFTIADRDGDGTDEAIAYKWDQIAGGNLTRTYNGTSTTILTGVQDFELTYGPQTITVPGDPITSEEEVLASYYPPLHGSDFAVSEYNWIGQYILPENLPADAITWSVTRIIFAAKISYTANGRSYIQIQEPDENNRPSGTVLEEYTMNESDLSYSYEWQYYTFSNAVDRDPDEGICFIVKWRSKNNSCEVYFDDWSGSNLLPTYDGGASWPLNNGKSMVYYLYGTYTYPGPVEQFDRMQTINIALNTGADSTTQVNVAVNTLNQPLVP